MMGDFQSQYEQRAQACAQDMRIYWQGLAAKYGLDMQQVLYAASDDFTTVFPTQVRLNAPGLVPPGGVTAVNDAEG